MDNTKGAFSIEDSGYILRSYREVWKEQLRAAAAPDEVTRLPKMRIGAAMGVYVITGQQHAEAAEYMLGCLAEGLSLVQMITLAQLVEDEFQVDVSIDYGPGRPEICKD